MGELVGHHIGVIDGLLSDLNDGRRLHLFASNGLGHDFVGYPDAAQLLDVGELDVLELTPFADPGLHLDGHQLALADPNMALDVTRFVLGFLGLRTRLDDPTLFTAHLLVIGTP